MKKIFVLSALLALASITYAQTTTIQAKAFLQGAYLGNDSMSSLINSSGHLPLSQPYSTAPWNYPGAEQLSAIPANMVDWVLLELRDQLNNSLAYRAALLLNDGSIVDTNLSSDIIFDGIADGNYYLLVDHRNHLPVMSAQAISAPSAISYDFSDTLNFPAIGGHLAQKELESGVFGLIAGDVNKDGIIKYSGAGNDRSLIIQRIIGQTGSTSLTATTDGYFPEDLSMDGQVKYAGAGNDATKIILTLIGMTGSTSITTTYNTPALVPPPPPFACGDSLLDNRDGQKYATVKIGNQCWMAENLNVGTMTTGTSDQADNSILEKYCYDNDSSNCSEYGALYQWTEMMGYVSTEGAQGICPADWHIPTDAEWCTLMTYLDPTVSCNATNWQGTGTDAGGKLKESGTAHWDSPNTGATNSSGFTALGNGYRGASGNFDYLRSHAYFWSSSEESIHDNGFYWSLVNGYAKVRRNHMAKNYGYSVRCIADTFGICSPQPEQADAGPDSLGIAGDSVQLWANQSAVGNGQWVVASASLGNQGTFSDSTAADAWFYGQPGVIYELVWMLYTVCDTTYDTVLVSFAQALSFFPCGDTLTDARDGKTYPTVQIGTQCWMMANLNVGVMINGTSSQTDNTIPEKYCYNNDSNNCSEYGGLYQWDEAMNYSTTDGAQGICPDGWHLPTDNDWCTLTTYLDSTVDCNVLDFSGTDAGAKMKETGNSHWTNSNTGATNSSGFTAMGGGYRSSGGGFSHINTGGYFWSSTIYSSSQRFDRYLYDNNNRVGRYNSSKTSGESVRCLSDTFTICTPQPDQADAGPDSLGIAGDSIQLYANTPSVGSGQWAVVSGSGGVVSDSSAADAWFYGQPGESYELVWMIYTVCDTTYDTVLISFAHSQTFNQCGDTLTDIRDGKRYPTVHIGTQCWMAANLNVGEYTSSNYVNNSNHSDVSDNGIIEKYCYDNDDSQCSVYGGLYDWEEAMDYTFLEGSRGICPENWHMPGDNEWVRLEGAVDSVYGVFDTGWDATGWRGYNAGGQLKDSSTGLWSNPNVGAIGNYAFNGLPGGHRAAFGNFATLSQYAYYWSSTSTSSYLATFRSLSNSSKQIRKDNEYRTYGFSVRCVLDSVLPCIPQPEQADAGADSLGIAGDSIQLYANTPSVGSGQWAVVSGSGGVVSDSSAADAWFYGQPGESFELVWMIYTVCDTTYDTVLISFAHAQTFNQCGDTLTDIRDGKRYPTVHIGTQCWMAENLNVGTMTTGTSDQANNSIPEKYCYNNDTNNCSEYGGLYQWDEAMDYTSTEGTQGICPPTGGWHLPTDAEWCTLTTFLDPTVNCNTWGYNGADAGGKMKEVGTTHWFPINTGATNSSGFSGLGAGYRSLQGNFYSIMKDATFWSSSRYSAVDAISRGIHYNLASIRRSTNTTEYGYSVRCMIDSVTCSPQPEQANAGADSLGIVGDSVQLWANQSAVGSGQWAVVSGSGGVFSDSSAADAWFYGQPGETYELVWRLYTNCGSTYDTVTISFTGAPWQCGDDFVDPRDQQVYPTVQIGDYCWFAANLNYGTRVDASVNMTDNGIAEKHCYNDDTSYCDTYGGLYQWDEAMQYESLMGAPGLCPDGWHISTDAEWKNLEGTADSQYGVGDSIWDIANWRGYDVGKNLKATSSWDNNGNGTDLYGFTALAAGRTYNGGSASMGSMTYIWVALEYNTQMAWCRYIRSDYDHIRRGYFYKTDGRSVRCVMNDSICSPQPDQANAGADSLGIAGESVQLYANASTVASGQWLVASGNGGTFSDSTAADSWFYGVAGETYELVWMLYTTCGATYDTVIISFAPGSSSFACGDSLLDSRDGQNYATVQIGTQCWMAENLNVGTMINYSVAQSDNSMIEKHCYNNDLNNCSEYGALYQWTEIMGYVSTEGAQGICPAGWHIPTDAEWCTLTSSLDPTLNCSQWGWFGTDAGGKMKEAGTTHWNSPNTGATNSSGFTAIPAGYNDDGSGFSGLGDLTYIWSSTEEYSTRGIAWGMKYDVATIDRYSSYYVSYSFSGRCLKD